MRRYRGHVAAEKWRVSLPRRTAAGLAAFVMPTATLDIVRRRFCLYAELAEWLTPDEVRIVEAVLAERVEAERLGQVAKDNARRQAERYPLEIDD